uniref:Mitotic spindle assembly checkpoint protein MAD1 put n=2 Tax=Albugo laibachii Nc14 TaxID=890382 RepID=F0W147_9STRA|nr:mitotic spindle assembly checkpoint protein MAD1 put [Albugo laibachii Nc14]CCA26769.1 mitotic spindle assembly checkpoint protein MAD1 put [Albugo laibachii Nc14]|eukprot:CCA26769.1 mitotic spindle assembly checkpoint protein MAD1 put [Albugo laibachii Nc14]
MIMLIRNESAICTSNPPHLERYVSLSNVSITSMRDNPLQEHNISVTHILNQNADEKYQGEIKRDIQLDKLHRQLQLALAEEEALRLELKDLKTQLLDTKLEAEKKMVEYDTRLRFLTTQLHEWKEKALENESVLITFKKRANLENELLKDELESLKVSDSAEVMHSDTEGRMDELQAQLENKENALRRMEQTLVDAKEALENAETVRSLHEKIQKMEVDERKLKEELRNAKVSAKDAVVTKEKLYQVLQESYHAEYRNQTMRKELSLLKDVEETHKTFIDQFHTIARDPESCITLDDLQRDPGLAVLKLYNSRQEELENVTVEKGTLKVELKRVQIQCEAMREETETLHQHVRELNENVKAKQYKLVQAEHTVVSLRYRNKELVEILRTYADDPAKGAHLTQKLQDLVSMQQSLENTFEEVPNTSQKKPSKEMTSTKETNLRLANRIQEANTQSLYHKKRPEQRDFDAEVTKVLHLALNPTSEVLEQNRPRASENSGKASSPTTTTSYETVEGQKMLNQRLKEVFRDQIQQYREAIYLLTGYKVDLRKSNGSELLRLRSMYAVQKDDELLVRMDKTGNLELLDTEYCRQIDQRVLGYLTTCRSFPAFLGNLTLHLFEKQTFQGI